MTIRGILFDKDGTLLDYHLTWMPVNRTAALHAARGDAVLGARLLEIGGYDAATGRVDSGSPLAAWNTAEIADLWARELPGSDPSRLRSELDRIFVEGGQLSAAAVMPLNPLFQSLRARGLRLGVATSDSEEGARASLAAWLDPAHLDFVAGYDSGHGGKPGPGMVLAFCDRVGLPPAAVAVVGDNLHDLEMGRRAGAGLKVGVLTGTSEHADLAADADHVLDSIADLEALLDRL